MVVKDTVVSLSKVLSLPNASGVNRTFIDIIINEEIPILCINRNSMKKRLMPFKVLYDNKENFWQLGGGWEYYITLENLEVIKEKATLKSGAWDNARPRIEEKPEVKIEKSIDSASAGNEGFGKEYVYFSDMTSQ